MKIHKNYVLKQVADQHVVVPIGSEAVKFQGMISLNKTGAFLFECLMQEQTLESLVHAMLEKFDVEIEKALKDINAFLDILEKHNLLER
ncbi:Uncharacterised protein [Acholeplasma oculi]|nr:PqqD family protein [Acholeplasma oculi]SKC39480.1 Coenzyme PQQ synthesis protein D (PqqD) [Acholeplasma oculi]SUT91800.1 Uncharacterised protein [Acholeplasma oculi]